MIKTQKRAVGIFICFEENVTKEAKDAAHIKFCVVELPMDKIQLLTIEDLFAVSNLGFLASPKMNL